MGSQFRPRKEWKDLNGGGGWRHYANQLLAVRLEPSTKKGYATAVRTWRHFTERENYDQLPTLQTTIHFITQLTLSGYTDKYIGNIMSGLRDWLYEHGLKADWDHITSDQEYLRLREAAKKHFGRLQGGQTTARRKLPMDKIAIKLVFDVSNNVDGLYDDFLFWTIVLVGVQGLFRLGELVWPDAKDEQSWRKVMKRVETKSTEEGFTLKLPYMKNDRFFGGSQVTLPPNSCLMGFNPVLALKRYLLLRDATHGDHLALFIRKNGSIPTRSWFVKRLQAILGKDYAGHSLRAGGATLMAENGFSAVEIMKAGRWRGEVFIIYIRKYPSLENALRRRGLWNGKAFL